jgi:DNA-binding Lrp family transcriptional regulator
MLQQGIIKSFNVSIDYKKIGYNTEVFIFISFLTNIDISQRELAKRIAKLPGIYEVHIISGEYDLLLKARGKSLEDIGVLVVDKLRQLKGVGRTLTCACFETVKEEL